MIKDKEKGTITYQASLCYSGSLFPVQTEDNNPQPTRECIDLWGGGLDRRLCKHLCEQQEEDQEEDEEEDQDKLG